MLESLSPQLVFCVRAGPARQDNLLPYMADCRHTPDTLFFVAEEDFRLTREHARWNPEAVAAQLVPQPAGLPEMPKLLLGLLVGRWRIHEHWLAIELPCLTYHGELG